MNSLKTLLLVSGVILLSSCGDDASSRVNDKNVEASKERVAEANKGFPTMTFTDTKHDFGDIVEGDVVETVFKFKNTGVKKKVLKTENRKSYLPAKIFMAEPSLLFQPALILMQLLITDLIPRV